MRQLLIFFMTQAVPDNFESAALGNLFSIRGSVKRDYNEAARREDIVRTFSDETGIDIREKVSTAYNRDGMWDGMASSLVIESKGEVVYEERGGRTVVNKPGEWRCHVEDLLATVRAQVVANKDKGPVSNIAQ